MVGFSPGFISRMHLHANKRVHRVGLALAALATCALFLAAGRNSRLLPHLNIPGLSTYDGDDDEIFYPFETISRFRPVSFSNAADKTADELCESFPRHLLQHAIQPVLKMAHHDVAKRELLTAQLEGPSRCFGPQDLLVFSDMDESVGGYDVIDVLGSLPKLYWNTTDNKEWENYMYMQELAQTGRLDVDEEATKEINGWSLDKFKFLVGIEKAWELKPGRDWYVFYETDTYVFWDNMVRFLGTLDPEKEVYMGSPSPGRHDPVRLSHQKDTRIWFANGGPGYVLSRSAMIKLLSREAGQDGRYTSPSLSERFYTNLRNDCCGDSVLGWCLWEMGISLSGYWPLFNPHPLHGLPFSDTYWCQPVLTLHKTRPADMLDIWRWEYEKRDMHRPLLYKDLFELRHPGRPDVRDDWDNGKWAGFQPDHVNDMPPASFGECAAACERKKECLQYRWKESAGDGMGGGVCLLMREIRLGEEKMPEMVENDVGVGVKESVSYKSGWMLDRIRHWKSQRQCLDVHWVPPSTKRVF